MSPLRRALSIELDSERLGTRNPDVSGLTSVIYFKKRKLFLHQIRKFSKEKFSKLLSLRTFFQNFFHFQSPQKTVFSKMTKKVIKFPRYFLLSKQNYVEKKKQCSMNNVVTAAFQKTSSQLVCKVNCKATSKKGFKVANKSF